METYFIFDMDQAQINSAVPAKKMKGKNIKNLLYKVEDIQISVPSLCRPCYGKFT